MERAIGIAGRQDQTQARELREHLETLKRQRQHASEMTPRGRKWFDTDGPFFPQKTARAADHPALTSGGPCQDLLTQSGSIIRR